MGKSEPMQKIYCVFSGEIVGSNPKRAKDLKGVERVHFFDMRKSVYVAVKLSIFNGWYRVEIEQ